MSNQITRYLGIDWGEKRIGLAIGEGEIKIASPFKVVENIGEIKKVIADEEITHLILGNPLKMRSIDEAVSEKFNQFKNNLEKINLPVILVDERLTSKQADSLVGNKKTKAPRDAVSAQLILQAYLDSSDSQNSH